MAGSILRLSGSQGLGEIDLTIQIPEGHFWTEDFHKKTPLQVRSMYLPCPVPGHTCGH